ncbi:MAG: hypothetical protein HY687_05795 [Chloroflexi bacterium]|nr:hypothetical protein [Chloroflexota bacterium]
MTPAIIAILAITALDGYALSRGIDGLLLLTSIGIISGLGGVVVLHQLSQVATFIHRFSPPSKELKDEDKP